MASPSSPSGALLEGRAPRSHHLGWLHAFSAEVNRVLVRSSDREQLLDDVCRLAIGHWQLRRAWIEMGAGADATVVAMHAATQDADGDESGDVSASAPLFVDGQQIGTLHVCTVEPGLFEADSLALLEQVADNISFTLAAIDNAQRRCQAETELRQLNEALEQRVAERTAALVTANRDLEAFAYSVSHDLRTPLRAIDGYSRMLVEDHGPALDAEAQRLLGVIRGSAQRMGGLIDALLRFSRVGRADLHALDVDMTAVARSVLEEQRHADPTADAAVEIAYLGRARVDPTLIRQVWGNLIGNALKFTRGHPEPRVEIRAEQRIGEVAYLITDNGAGFDQEYVDRLFRVFQRLHKSTEFEGDGVGLAIVQRIVQRHGGSVWAEGRLGQGATFGFTIPTQEPS